MSCSSLPVNDVSIGTSRSLKSRLCRRSAVPRPVDDKNHKPLIGFWKPRQAGLNIHTGKSCIHKIHKITSLQMIQSKQNKRVFMAISPCINGWLLSSTTQSSRQLNIELGWQKIEEDVRLVLDNRLFFRHGRIRYDTRCYFNVRSKANMRQLNLPHGTDN